MATAVVSGFLDINNGGAPFDDLALKVYGGMVLEAYNKNSTTKGRHVHRTIQNGKSAQFPTLGTVGTNWHTRGTEITFLQVNSNERIIEIQGLLLSPLFLDILDEAKTHFDIRRPYATQQGVALALEDDLRVLMSMVVASRTATPNVTGGTAGAQIVAATAASDAAVLKGSIYEAAENMDENNIPSMDRFLWLAPAQWYLLLQDGEFLDRDFGGGGSRTGADMPWAAGFQLVKTNNLPSTNETGDTTFPTNLRLNYGTTVAIAAHPSAAGSLSLMDLKFEAEYDMNRQGHMLIAKYAKGHDYLRPEAAFEIASA